MDRSPRHRFAISPQHTATHGDRVVLGRLGFGLRRGDCLRPQRCRPLVAGDVNRAQINRFARLDITYLGQTVGAVLHSTDNDVIGAARRQFVGLKSAIRVGDSEV